MKKGLILLGVLGLITSALGLSSGKKAERADATTVVNGGNAWTFEETKLSALYFEMNENAAPYNSSWNLRYKLVTQDALVIIKNNGEEKMIPAGNISGTEAICKYSPTRYYLEQWFLNENTTGKLAVGDTVKLDGQFINAANDVILEISHSEFYIRTETQVLTFNDDSKPIIREDFLNKFTELFDSEIYEPEDANTLLSIQNDLISAINAATSMSDVHSAYNYAVSQADLLEKSEEGFLNYKEAKKQEIRNYVSLDDYFEGERTVVENIMDTCCDQIDLAATTSEIKSLLNQAKADIDAVKTRVGVMEEAVLNKTSGYEEYLQSYDQVTLNDLSLGNEVTFHGLKDERNDEINTNVTERNMFNSFVPNKDNKNGNVIFNFNYQSNCNTNAGANMLIVLRGMKYYGYKFGIDTNKDGIYFTKTTTSGDNFIWGSEGTLTSNSDTYHISIGAIDLIEGNRTWISIKVNGVMLRELMTDSFDFCYNPRVSLSNNDNGNGDAAGITTITNYYPTGYECKIPALYAGLFEYEEGHNDVTTNLHLKLDPNVVPFDSEKAIRSYSMSPENIKLVRNNIEYQLGNSDIPVIAKYSETNYQLYLSSLFNETITSINNGDKLVIKGMFTYFDPEEGTKMAFEVMESMFVYDASKSTWEPEFSLESLKVDTIRKIDAYLTDEFLAQYDLEEQYYIAALAAEAKADVNNASDIQTIKAIYASFVSQVNAVLTSLGKYLESLVKELREYLSDQGSNYYPDDWQEINAIKERYSMLIKQATTKEQADSLLATAKRSIDDILTIAEHDLEALNVAKAQATQQVKDIYAAIDVSKLTDEQLTQLNNDTQEALEGIKNAQDIKTVNEILNAYKEKYESQASGGESEEPQKAKGFGAWLKNLFKKIGDFFRKLFGGKKNK